VTRMRPVFMLLVLLVLPVPASVTPMTSVATSRVQTPDASWNSERGAAMRATSMIGGAVVRRTAIVFLVLVLLLIFIMLAIQNISSNGTSNHAA